MRKAILKMCDFDDQGNRLQDQKSPFESARNNNTSASGSFAALGQSTLFRQEAQPVRQSTHQ